MTCLFYFYMWDVIYDDINDKSHIHHIYINQPWLKIGRMEDESFTKSNQKQTHF